MKPLILTLLLFVGMVSASVTCVPFYGASSVKNGTVSLDIYIASTCTGTPLDNEVFSYTGGMWSPVIGNCTGASPINLTDYKTYYFNYSRDTYASSCLSFVAEPPGTTTSQVNNFYGGTSTPGNQTVINNYFNISEGGVGSEVDPIFTSNNASIWAAITGLNNLSGSEVASLVGNWSADKSNYYTKAQNNILFNNLSSVDIASLVGNWTADKAGYTPIGNCITGYVVQNLTGAGPQCVPSSSINGADIVALVGNWTADKSNYYTSVQTNTLYNNWTASQIGALVGNWSGNLSSYTTNVDLVATVGNWSADKTTVYANLSSINLSIVADRANISSLNISLLTKGPGTMGASDNNTINSNISSLNLSIIADRLNMSDLNLSMLFLELNVSSLNTTLATNTSNLQARIASLNSSFNLNITDLNLTMLTLKLNITSLNISKAGIGTATCGAGTTAQNVTTTATGITSQCVAASAASGSGNVTSSNGTINYYARFTNATNIANGDIYWNGTCTIIPGSTLTLKVC